ncbi:hypothetical protein [Epilithonimonas hispanica]|uniref:Acetyltransferase (GNAT) domain-containing protein n=1 Tax=Epilithonimonas hispanica TaxID=358687 RepID=A0A3D9D170_9FLAO|nr:hypothetical protein [Epilithonimonas hispanica]REC71756.1 hypothetical protein DRF58_05270 [Epilithonimonas hispanica]
MIKRLKYHEIDFDKYNACIENSLQNSDYAQREFLDIVTKKSWELIIYDDYEAVMPVPLIVKFGFKIVLMPKLCQQLGIFSNQDSVYINNLFYNYLTKNYIVLFYAFNGNNEVSNIGLKKSYIIPKDQYSEVKKRYSIHRRRNVRIIGDLENNIIFRNSLKSEDRAFFVENMKGIKKKEDASIYFDLMQTLYEQKLMNIEILEYKNQIESMAGLYCGKTNHYLSLFVNKNPLSNTNIPSIVIDNYLKKTIADQDFDFMGSDVENVAKFNERFGAIAYKYPIVSNSKKEVLIQILKKIFFLR